MSIDRYQDEEGRRHYVHGDHDVLSVTTILGLLEEDDTGLQYWKMKNNGKGNAAHWEHLFWYKTYRGTLCHYKALSKFDGSFDSEDEMWGSGEQEALQEIMLGPSDGELEEASYDREKVLYSILKDHGYVSDWYDFKRGYKAHSLIDVLRHDEAWFASAFDEICELLGINQDSVINVEKFMLETILGYGGQCDLLYEDPDGNIVVADLKTSSGLRQKHVIQAVAYSKAIEQAEDIPVDKVDRVEVIRIHPDTRTWEVHSHVEATDHHTTKHWFKDKYGNWEYDSLEEMWHTFCKLADEAHGR